MLFRSVVEQHLSLFQVERVKAVDEPAVGRSGQNVRQTDRQRFPPLKSRPTRRINI